MDGEERFRRNAASCAGKSRFDKMVEGYAVIRKIAEKRIKGAAKFNWESASVYQCAACLGYHIGHAEPDDEIKSWV